MARQIESDFMIIERVNEIEKQDMTNASDLSNFCGHIEARNLAVTVMISGWIRGNEDNVEALLTGLKAQIHAVDQLEHHYRHCAPFADNVCPVCQTVATEIIRIRDSACEMVSLLLAGLEGSELDERAFSAALKIAESQRAYIDNLLTALSSL